MIDAHFHAWQLSRGDYGWLTPELGVIYRDVQVSDWEQHAKAHGIEGGVLVQAAPTFEETLFLLNQAHQHAMVKGVVGWIDMLAPEMSVNPLDLLRLSKSPQRVRRNVKFRKIVYGD